MYRLLQQLAASGGTVPLNEAELRGLPGVGEYCAAALVSLHAGQRAVVIDSNIVRVLARLIGRPYDGETRRKKWLRDLAAALTPALDHTDYNYGLLDIAMTTCRARPQCNACPIAFACVTGSPEMPAAQRG